MKLWVILFTIIVWLGGGGVEGWKIKDVPLEEARELEPQAAEVFAQIVIKALRDSMTPENQDIAGKLFRGRAFPYPRWESISNVKLEHPSNFLCSSLFIDLGTGRGTQILKYFYPDQFPKQHPFVGDLFQALVEEEYEEEGASFSSHCAIGFEANPSLEPELIHFSRMLWERGKPNFIFKLGASNETNLNGVPFYEIRNSRFPTFPINSGIHRGASTAKSLNTGNHTIHTIATLDVAPFIRSLIDTLAKFHYQQIHRREKEQRKGGDEEGGGVTGGSTGGLEEWRPTVVVKSDMEGEEYAVVPALLKDGVRRHPVKEAPICSINVLLLSLHKDFAPDENAKNTLTKKHIEEEIEKKVRCTTDASVVVLNDDAYLHNRPLQFLSNRRPHKTKRFGSR